MHGLAGTNPRRCKYHKRASPNTQVSRLHAVYKKYLGPKLSEAIAQATGVSPDEQVAVYHEIALLREMAGQHVALFSAAYESGNVNATLAAGELMREALAVVVDTCSKAAKIQEKQRDQFSIHDLKYVVDQLMIIHSSIAKDQPELAKAFADAVEKELILPTASKGVSVLPGDTDEIIRSVVDFDAEIPLYEPGSDDD